MSLPASHFQCELARFLGIEIDGSSFAVAAAQIETAISPALFSEPESVIPVTEKQVQFATDLGINVSQDNMKVASARIQEVLDQRNAALIQKMQLEAGIRVRWKKWNRDMTISSIATNGRLWFKGNAVREIG